MFSSDEMPLESCTEDEQTESTSDITWLDCPYEEKDEAKAALAQWDPQQRRWYAAPHVNLSPLRRWIKTRVYLNCDIRDSQGRCKITRWEMGRLRKKVVHL